jgi:hypothetical protein
MENLGLKQEVLDKILTDDLLKGHICKALNRGFQSVENYANANDPRLTQKAVTVVLSSYLKVPENDLFNKNLSSEAITGAKIPA